MVLAENQNKHNAFIGLVSRMPLYFGMLGIAVNIIIIIYESMLSWSMRRFDEKWELWSISALPFITLLGIISFGL